MAKCPQCGLEWGGEEAAADASAGRPRTTVTDPGGCLLTVLLLAGLAVVLPGAVWLGSLAGFDLWHWMVTYGTSVTTVARVILVFSLAVLLVVLAVRRPIGRHGGRRSSAATADTGRRRLRLGRRWASGSGSARCWW